jgi:hypothetical protein
MHSNFTDYVLNGKSVDLKTTRRNISSSGEKVSIYQGERRIGIIYAVVAFSLKGATVSIEQEVHLFDWYSVSDAFRKWSNAHRNVVSTSAAREINKSLFQEIKLDLQNYFQKTGIVCRIIYRTSQHKFGNESPDNLKSKNILDSRITVFISFNEEISTAKIFDIYAFPDSCANDLPMMRDEDVFLHKAKVDLRRIPSKFRFTSIENLKSDYLRIWL